MQFEEIRLRRDNHGLCTVALLIGDRWIDVIRDNVDVIDHCVTTSDVEAAIAKTKPQKLTDEQIDAVGERFLQKDFMKTWGWRQFAREIEKLRLEMDINGLVDTEVDYIKAKANEFRGFLNSPDEDKP
jgi:hypothetical protein